EGAGQEMRVYAQGGHALDGAGRHGSVQRRQDEMPAVGGAHGGFRRYRIANLADHDHVRRLPPDAAEQVAETDVERRIDLRLANALQGVFDRILDGVDLALAVVEVIEAGVERRRLARSGWPRDENQAAGAAEHLQELIVVFSQQAEML